MSKQTAPRPSIVDTGGGFFTPLANTKPYFKAAFEGFAGSGKSYTLAQIAVGIWRHIGSTKPVIIFDTERASKFLRPIFDEAGIPALVRESRSLADLKEAMRIAREGLSDVFILDSVSHVWEDFVESYKRKANRSRIEFQDWGILKPTWKREFSDPLVNDPIHFLMTGRAGYEYENEVNKETGKREIFKSGIKMKVEGETAYEPDILVLMERFEEVLTDKKQVWREATVIKDRSALIDGKTFKNPTFSDFLPAIEAILKDPTKKVDVIEANAADLVRTEEEKREFTLKRDILLEKIEAFMVKSYGGQTGQAKAEKVKAIEVAFGTSSWTEITRKHPDALEEGYKRLEVYTAERLAELTNS